MAWLLGENKNTVQPISQIKDWQVRKRKSGRRHRVRWLPSVASRPHERWATDMARVGCGVQHRWCAPTLVMDCFTCELIGWRLGPTGNAKAQAKAKAAEAALEVALGALFRYDNEQRTHPPPGHENAQGVYQLAA